MRRSIPWPVSAFSSSVERGGHLDGGRLKVRSFCEANGLQATISQGAVADLVSGRANADFIVATTQVPSSVTIPVIQGLPFLTGVGVDAVQQQIRAQFD